MHARHLIILSILSPVLLSLLSHQLRILLGLTLVQLVQGMVGRRVRVDRLMHQCLGALDDLCHGHLGLPVLPLQHRQANLAALVHMYMLEISREADSGSL